MLTRARRAPLLLAISLLSASAPLHAAQKTGAPAVDEPTGFWRGATDAPVPATIQGGQVVRLPALRKLLASGAVLLVDVSNAPRKPEGLAPDAPWIPVPHKALPTALWIPGAGAGEVTPEFDAFLRDRIAAAVGGESDRPIVVYCHKRCWLSWNGAKRLIAYGYRRVYWYPDGIEGWRAAKLPTVNVAETVPKG